MTEFAGKVALVTGAGRGIGQAIAAALVTAGVQVAINDVDAGAAAETAAALGGRAFALPFDIGDPEAIFAASAAMDRLDFLVNNAGIEDLHGFDTMTLDHWDRITRVNLDGALFVSKAFVPLIRKNGGAIVNVASIQGVRARTGSLAYAAAKGGIVNLTRAMACDLAPDIRVNAVAPGFINTPMCIRPDGSHEYEQDWFQQVYIRHGHIPLRLPGRAADVAGPAVFLLSDAARYITGQVLMVDGGLSATF